MSCIISVLVQQRSRTSNPAARMIQAAVLNSRFKRSSDVCVEIGSVMEISENSWNSKKYSAVVVPDPAGCWLALQVVALITRLSFNRQPLHCWECS